MGEPAEARARYLEIAARRFAAAGFHGVSLAALAGDAGVTKQALLHFFGAKERLYAEVLSALCDKLCEELAALAAETPEARLIAHFDEIATRSPDRAQEARLVARALLDSDPAARFWPLKPYLDALIALTLATRRWRGASAEEALAGISQLLGVIQYAAISSTAVRGMYGEDAGAEVRARSSEQIGAAVRAFVSAS